MDKSKAAKKQLSRYQRLEGKLLTKLKALVRDDKVAHDIKLSLNKGGGEYLRMDRLESVAFDMEWVEKIEDCLPELGTIVNNPRKTIKTVTEVVPVELAKKTNAESLRHLSMNSQYVKSVDAKGNVTPEKILNIGADDDYHIYENRFIATLIKTLVLFVEKRFEYLTKYAPFTDHNILYLKNDSVIDGSKVNIETKISLEKHSTNIDIDLSNEYLARVNNIRTYLKYYLNSPFMKLFKSERMLSGNILMTNILRKNPQYHKCYELYRFINRYNKLGVNYTIKEEFYPITKKRMEELNYANLATFLMLSSDEPHKKPLEKQKKVEPKMLTTLDDEIYAFSPLSNKPIEFLRIDEEYKKFIEDGLKKKDVPEHMSKEEEKFYKDKVKAIKLAEIKQAALDELIKRKSIEIENYRLMQEQIAEQMRVEEEERKRLEELAREQEIQRLLAIARKEVKSEALKDLKEENEAEKAIALAKKEKAKREAETTSIIKQILEQEKEPNDSEN